MDTSFVVGVIDDKDLWHAAAHALRPVLDAAAYQVFAFDCVMTEVVSVLARRTHEKRRVAQIASLLTYLRGEFPTRSIVWLYPDLPKLYDAVVALVEQSSGELNFNDALIALACRDRNIPYLASFDADFDQVAWLKSIAHPDQL